MSIRWRLRSLLRRSRSLWPDADEWLALEAYRGLTLQAFNTPSFNPVVTPLLWNAGRWLPPDRSLRSPARRERDNASHHYGHDIQLKRHAGLPLVRAPMPWLLEHGLKVTAEASFEPPRSWSRGTLCMGPLRAEWVAERQQQPTIAIGPWIAYARSLLDPQRLEELRSSLGRTLLVVLAHSWGPVPRSNDLPRAINAIEQLCREQEYRSVIWLRHWQDPTDLPLPRAWIQACNGHRSNPWFLDALRTLLEISDGMASNSFGTHLGYAVHLNRSLHWLNSSCSQSLDALPEDQQRRERMEWDRRQALGQQLQLYSDDRAALRKLLTPYWGFDRILSPEQARELLLGNRP